MGKQLVIRVENDSDPKRVAWLEEKIMAMLPFWPTNVSPKEKVKRARPVEIERGRWELEIVASGSQQGVPPPLRAAGRTRIECLQNAVLAGAEAIRVWGIMQRRIAEVATDNAADAERWCAEHMREVEGA